MKKLFSLKRVAVLAIFSLSMIGATAQTESGLSLGSIKFVKPSASLSAAGRSLNIKMATKGISPEFYLKVGGVSFINTAVPAFDVTSIDLEYDSQSGKCCAVINGDKYAIPLDAWMLKPIVKYADSEYTAAVTLYGNEESRILFHPAFLDELLGLRLLQTDLMLVASPMDVSRLPQDDSERMIISENERIAYDRYDRKFKEDYDKDYWLYATKCGLVISCRCYNYLLNSDFDLSDIFNINLQSVVPNTYIFTDYDEVIGFDIDRSADAIVFSGKPYYRFATIVDGGEDVTEEHQLSKIIKESEELYNMNPVVFDAAYATCWWSAFFRYVKSENPDAWKEFVTAVENMADDPSLTVWTPVDYEGGDMNFYDIMMLQHSGFNEQDHMDVFKEIDIIRPYLQIFNLYGL